MQAWVYRSKGRPSKVLRLETDYPRPAPSANLVLVKVKAVSLNVNLFQLVYRTVTKLISSSFGSLLVGRP